MLATILKGDKATETTIAIIEAFDKLIELQTTVAKLSEASDEFQQKSLMQRGGDIDGHQVAMYNDLPRGMIAGTDPTNFHVNLGGWNCRYRLLGVTDAMVPDEVRWKLEEKSNFAENLNKEKLENKEGHINVQRAEFDAYDTSKWKKKYFDKKTGGYVVIERDRIYQSQKSKGEKEKFDREQGMNMTLARNGYAVEHLDDRGGTGYDIHLNGIKADLKKTGSHNNMVNYAKKAIRKQGADMAVFEFEKMYDKIHSELNRVC